MQDPCKDGRAELSGSVDVFSWRTNGVISFTFAGCSIFCFIILIMLQISYWHTPQAHWEVYFLFLNEIIHI